LRQSAQKVDESNSWKDEVTRRVAEHKERRIPATNESQANADGRHAASRRAAEAAARVAARYAKAPSYSEMLAEEARAAVRAAEAASRAALEAQAAAESVLAGLEAASAPTPAWEVEFFTAEDPEPAMTPSVETARNALPAAQAPLPSPPRPSFEIRWDADMPVRETGTTVARASRGTAMLETAEQNARQPAADVRSLLGTEGYEVVEPAQPIHANLIQFPRELVATRKMRPRRAEGPYAASMEVQGQLSIFEVEPWTISTEPAASGAATEAGTAVWTGPKWSGIELEEETREEVARPAAEPAQVPVAAPVVEDAELRLAPMNQRIMAAVVDFSLITGVFLTAALVAAVDLRVLPSIREIELGSVVAMALIGVSYLAIFFILGRGTPGMKYARLEISTFAGSKPTVVERCGRMAAMVVSLAPAGLGAAMAIFDEQHLGWHDRWSKTYLRRR
jgi:uncharacterized RDD family membrane protein YckC